MRRSLSDARRPMSALLAAAFISVAGLGSWRTFDAVWTTVGQQRLAYEHMTPLDREHTAVGALADPNVLDFWKSHLHRGDRFYLNIAQKHPGITAWPKESPWPAILGLIADYYFIPAYGVNEVKDATVVLSWDAPPSRAGARLASTEKLKLPGFNVSFSRVAT
jgi:hypothetical protein